jgi:lipoyl(octanoyl) transferase
MPSPASSAPHASAPVPTGSLHVERPGRIGYADALARQRAAAAALREGRGEETLFLLEHPPVVTLGRRATADHLLATPADLAARGVEVVESDRGGDVTFHGPGQVVGYPILDLRRRRLGAHTYLRFLEEVLIGVLATYGIRGFRDPEHTGVWTDQGKIAAMGIRVSAGVSLHGFALNANTDLAWFGMIVPCGIRGRAVASMDRILGRKVDLEELMDRIEDAFRAASPPAAGESAR